MGISKLSYGSGDNLFEISYKDDEIISTTGGTSYTSANFEANSFAAFQNRKLTQFFAKGADNSYNNANEDNCMWRKWDSNNKTDLLPGSDNADGFYTFNSLLTSVSNNRRIITDLTDMQRIIWRPEVMENPVTTVINGVSKTITSYVINTDTTQNYCDIVDQTNPLHYTAQNVPIFPWLLYPEDKKELQLHFRREDGLSPYGGTCTRRSGARVNINNRARHYPLSTAMVNYDVPVGNNQTFGFYSDDNKYLFACSLSTNNYAAGTVYCYIVSEDEVKLWLASCGFKFIYKNKLYKPVAENSVIVGYTDDMLSQSEWDQWHTKDDHEKPVTPPAPTPPGPSYDDDPWSGVSFSGVGVGGAGAFAKCYYMTSTELANLRTWMNSNKVPEGFDPMQQIIGLSQVPVSLSGDDNTTVQFVNSSAVYDPGVTRLVDSGVSTQISMGTPKRYSLGSVDITRRMQERGEPYLDYDCQIELYLPLIGMFSLDTQAVMGRTITAEAVLDPISGTLAAYAYVTRDGQNLPIAYGSTTIGVDLPISAQQYSVSRAALKQANAQLGTSLLSSTLSFIAAATAGGKGSGTGAKTATGSTNGLAAAGIREAGADYMKASQAGNVFGDFMQWGRTIRQLSYGNNTAIAGSFGGSTAQWSYPFTPYVKIIRPRYEKPLNYNHSQGVPCVQAKKVGDCTGFIQCIGVDVSGITRATDLERQAIQAALANGVFAGGGS